MSNWTTPTLRALWLRARFTWCLSSSRFDRTPATLLWAFALYARGRRIVVFTEVANDKRAAMLHRLPGWEVDQSTHGRGRDECAIAYRRRYFRKVWGVSRQVAESPIDVWPWGVWARFTLLEHWRTGQTVLVSGVHSPARVEVGDRWRTDRVGARNVRAYREMLETWPRILLAYLERDDVDHVLALGDLNVNLRRQAWRIRLARAFAPLRSVWAGRWPHTGSHKTSARLIDGGYTDMHTDSQRVGALARSSDHRPIFGRSWLRPIPRAQRAAWRRIVAARRARWAK